MLFNGLNDSLKLVITKQNIPRYEVKDAAPSTLIEVIRAFKETNKLIIWSGGSENTIYQDRTVNWMFRAWHDHCHIILNQDFTLDGETNTGLYQMSKVGDKLARIIEIEVIDQVKYNLNNNGLFVVDQVQFTIDRMKG